MARPIRALVAALLAVGLSGAVVATAGTDAGAASKPRTLTIGVIAPIDAGLTSFGQGIRNSVQLAVDQADADKTIPGWTVKLRVLDDSSDPAKGKAAAAKLAADPNVVAVVGPYNSGVAEQAAPVLAKRGIALVSPSNTLTSLTLGADPTHPKRPWKTYFRLVGPDSLQAEFLASKAHALGFSSAAVVSETKAVSKGLADRFADAFTADGGTVTVHQTVPDNATDFTTFLQAAAPTTPSLIFFGGEYNVAATLRTAATSAGLTVPVMGGDGMNDPAYISGAGAAAAGSYASGVGAPLATLPGANEFLAAYNQAGFTSAPTDYGPDAYDAANAVLAALKPVLQGKQSLPSNTRASVVSGLQKTHTTGVTGDISFDSYGDRVDPTFTLYTVAGSPLAWTPVP
ncbi:MAG TPA: branched-chain amino acid ABC transporter substrate-binding protein [Acidimicrobiia bacterium]|nr:branched-chain amino acid ABC transporter substrate-binding protein [Acidimicrobiia bacterium]